LKRTRRRCATRWSCPRAVSVAVSINGVLAPIDGRKRACGRQNSKGPAGYREVGCATQTFCDNGAMLGAIRMARAPEPNKRTLKTSLAAELHALRQAWIEAGQDRRRRRRQLNVPGRATARWRRGARLLPRLRAPPCCGDSGLRRRDDQDPRCKSHRARAGWRPSRQRGGPRWVGGPSGPLSPSPDHEV
jgi:hypothetical protein